MERPSCSRLVSCRTQLWRAACPLFAAALLTGSHAAQAANLSWDPTGTNPTAPAGGSGTWDRRSAFWSNGTTDRSWTDLAGTTDTADFAGTAGAATLGENLGALGLIFDTAGYDLATSANTLNLGASGINASSSQTGTTTISGTGGLNLVAAQTWTVSGGNTLSVSAPVANGGNLLTLSSAGTTTLSGVISGTGGLTKLGSGPLTLSGTSTYTGPTTVSAGTLSVTGALNGGGMLAVGGAGTLSGTGTLQGGANALSISGTLSPGSTAAANSLGTLTLATTGTLTLANTAIYQLDVTNPATKDLVNAVGATLVLQGGALTLRGTIDPSQTYVLFSGLKGETGSFGSVAGVPAGYQAVFGTTGTSGSLNYSVSFQAVPEPATWVLFGTGLMGLGASVRHRGRAVL